MRYFLFLFILFSLPALAEDEVSSTSEAELHFRLTNLDKEWHLELWKNSPLWERKIATDDRNKARKLTEDLNIALQKKWISLVPNQQKEWVLLRKADEEEKEPLLLKDYTDEELIKVLQKIIKKQSRHSPLFTSLQARRKRVYFLSSRLKQCSRKPSSVEETSDQEDSEPLEPLENELPWILKYYQQKEAVLAKSLSECKNSFKSHY